MIVVRLAGAGLSVFAHVGQPVVGRLAVWRRSAGFRSLRVASPVAAGVGRSAGVVVSSHVGRPVFLATSTGDVRQGGEGTNAGWQEGRPCEGIVTG